jgi:cytidylate kinase
MLDEVSRKTQNTHFMFNNFFSENRDVDEMVWKIIRTQMQQTTDDNIVWRKRIACWILKATNTHSEYVILIALPLQQWLQQSASTLRYTVIVPFIVLVLYCVCF